MVIAAAIPLGFAAAEVGGLALSAMAVAVKSLYGMAVEINEYLDKHIEDMKVSENPTVSRSGRILEMAKFGFGIGYITPVIIISVGQLILGNTLSAVATVANAATLTNPIAMTCAAIGAVYYGWGALSDVERNEMLDKLSKGLEVGIALINAVVGFVVDKTKELLSSKNFEELKEYIGAAAAKFGKTLGDVTHKLTDVLSDSVDTLKKKSGKALDKTAEMATQAYDTVKVAGGKAVDSTLGALEKAKSGDQSKMPNQVKESGSALTAQKVLQKNESR